MPLLSMTCDVFTFQWQVHLHSINDIPLVSDLGFFVEPGKHSLVSVDYSKVRQQFDFELMMKKLYKDGNMSAHNTVGK